MSINASTPSPSVSRIGRCTGWYVLAGVVLLAASVAGARAWHACRTGPSRCFETGLKAFASNDLDELYAAVEGLRDVVAYEPHYRLFEGMLLLRGGRLVQAIVQFGFAKEHPDTAALAYALSGEALCRGRQFRDADRILTTAGQLDPSYTDTHRWLAALYYDIGAMEHAREQLEIVAEQAPGDPRPKRLLGEIHRDFEKYDLAVDAYRESLRRDPNQPKREELLVDLAECLLKLRRFEEAREVLRECPRSARSLTLEAETFYEAGENGPAKKPLEEALALDSSYLGAMRLKARMALDANGPTLAAQILRRAVELHPKDHLAHYYLVQAYRRLGERQLAEKHLQVSRDLRALFQKFADLNQKAIKSPADAEIRYQLGVLAGQLDKRELARSWLEHALALDPNHAAARQALDNMSRQSSSPPQANGKR